MRLASFCAWCACCVCECARAHVRACVHVYIFPKMAPLATALLSFFIAVTLRSMPVTPSLSVLLSHALGT